jgi:DNA modification methylase
MEQSLLIEDLEIHYANVDELKPHPKNSHKHSDDQIERLCKIVEYNKFRTPLTLDKKTGTIVCGHGRLMAAKKLGMKKVPVVYQDFESEDHIYAHLVADNAIGKDTWATLDLGMINQEVLNMGPDFDIDVLGLKDFVIEPVEKYDEEKEDDVPEVKHDPITKRGDVWLLGEHRVMCGDSTMIDDVEKLMNGEKADMVFTDPPYKLTGGGSKGSWGKNLKGTYFDAANYKDSKRENLFDVPSYEDWISLFSSITNENHEIFVMGNNRSMLDLYNELKKAEYKIHNILLMLKNSGFPNFWYTPKAEFILYMYKGRAIVPLKKCQNNTFEVKMPKGDGKNHVNQKPVEFIIQIIENHQHKKIFEPFCGSGSTLIACEKTSRKCYGMELDEHYCDVIINRWQEYTGKEAVLESTKESYNELSKKDMM